MKRFWIVFFSVLLTCSLLAALAYAANILVDIVASNEASVNNESVEKKRVVVLDAGHGGMDGGAVGIGGILEKDLNLDLVMKLAALLEKEGVSVVLTRDRDTLLTFPGASSAKNGDLRARLKVAQESGECLFVSIHMNKFADSNVKGVTLYHSPNHPGGKVLAEGIMALVRENLQPENKRVIKEADSSLYILHRITQPAVLVECGFLSNPYEASLLASEEYRARLSSLLSQAILAYLSDGVTA